MESGFLTGKYNENSKFEEKDFRNKLALFQNKENYVMTKPLFDLMGTLAEKYEVSISQIALNWILKNEKIIPIPGAKSIEQVKSNIEAANFRITDQEYKELCDISANIDIWIY